MRYQNPQLIDALAAEYVLGTLQGRARRRFERLLLERPPVRAQVQAWERRLNQLAQAAPPVAPPAQAWRQLERRLFAESSRPRWYESLAWWRGLAVGSTVLAGVLAVLLVVAPLREAKEPPGYVVLISHDKAAQPIWVVSTTADMKRFHVKNTKAMDMPAGSQCLLWLRPEGSDQLYALGALPDKGDDKMLEVDDDMRSMLPGQLYVSVEQTDGKMPAKPANPLKYEGKWMPLTKI